MSPANQPSAGESILAMNCGSSSLKFALYTCFTDSMAGGPREQLQYMGSVERIGEPGPVFRVAAGGTTGQPEARQVPAPDHRQALNYVLDWLEQQSGVRAPAAIGHRIVHGGSAYDQPALVTDAVTLELKRLIPLAPLHLPIEIATIEALRVRYPSLPQVACFDTAFHRSMPRVAQLYGLPRRFLGAGGLVRYGFHGLSYESILSRMSDLSLASDRLIIAHLGNGASMAAVRSGRSVDTTMGLTPIGGLVMSTRSGDLDPGVMLYLLEAGMATPADLRRIVDDQGGLLGVSETSSDMQDLLARMATDTRAAEAVDLFIYTAKKHLAAMAGVLGGIDSLTFTGGIGEHSAPVRQGICAGLEHLGIYLDEERNAGNHLVVSAAESPVTVRVIQTNEELMIARHTSATVARDG